MKARRVKGLDPDGALADNALRIARVRVDELVSLASRALDPGETEALHDARIAAKRLRYVLEVTAPAFGPAARRGIKAARDLQDLLGEIHDCDVMLPRVRRHVKRLRAEDAEALRTAAAGSKDLGPAAARAAPNRARYRGLEALIAYLTARRAVLFERFLRDWGELEERRFFTALLEELGSPPSSRAGRSGAGAP